MVVGDSVLAACVKTAVGHKPGGGLRLCGAPG